MVLFIFASALAHAQTIFNGGFEEPPHTADGIFGGISLNGWTGNPAFVFRGETAGWPLPQEGQQYVDLGWGAGTYRISQALTTKVAGEHRLSWFHNTALGFGPGNTSYSVEIADAGGHRIADGSFDPGNFGEWKPASMGAVLSPGDYVVTFISGPGGIDALLDGVAIRASCLVWPCPTNVVVAGHSPEGTVVYFETNAYDACTSAEVRVECHPPSGSLFPPGTTEVLCHAASIGQTNECRFQVTVLGTGEERRAVASGRVVDPWGQPINGIPMQLTGGGKTVATRTEASGDFRFFNIVQGGQYVVKPLLENYTFDPAERSFTAGTGRNVSEFIATSPYAAWHQSAWSTNDFWAATLPSADPDGDGKPNLVEYAFGYDPKGAEEESPLRVRHVEREGKPWVVVELNPAPEITDVKFGVESTSDLIGGTWRPAAEDIELTSLPCGPPTCPISFSFPVEEDRQFFRFRVIPSYPVGATGRRPLTTDPLGESLRVGFFDVRAANPLAALVRRPNCDAIPDRLRKIARAIAANVQSFDIIALAGAFTNGEDPCGFGRSPIADGLEEFLTGKLGASSTTWIDNLAAGEAGFCESAAPMLWPVAGYANAKGELSAMLQSHYPYSVRFIEGAGYHFEDSGLMLFSRLPFEPLPSLPAPYLPPPTGVESYALGVRLPPEISRVAFAKFANGTGWDRFTSKGAGLVRVRSERTGRRYSVVFGHLDEGADAEIRQVQLNEVRALIEAALAALPEAERASEHVLLLGGLNIDGDLKKEFETGPGMPPPLLEWRNRFDTPGEFFTDTMKDVWAAQCNPRVVDFIYLDRGLTATEGGAKSDGRTDYIFMNEPAVPYENRSLAVQHMALAYCLNDDAPTGREVAFGTAGPNRLSDHIGVVADINVRTPGCTIADAWRPTLRATTAQETIAGELLHPGSIQWYRFDSEGTYSFALRGEGTPDDTFSMQVYDSRDVSRPVASDGSRTVETAQGQAVGYTFTHQRAPLFVRIAPRERGGRGKFQLTYLQHQGFSKEDAIVLLPNGEPFTVEPVPGHGSEPRWFQIPIEQTTTGAGQHLIFQKRDIGPRAQRHRLELLDDALVPAGGGSADGTGTVEIDLPGYTRGISIRPFLSFEEFVAGPIPRTHYLKVSPLDGTGEPFSIEWSTDLTVLFGIYGDYLECVATDDPEICFILCFDGDDEIDWERTGVRSMGHFTNVLHCRRGRDPLGCLGIYRDEDAGFIPGMRTMGVDIEPMKFALGEEAYFELVEIDGATEDEHLSGTVPPLPREVLEDKYTATIVGAGSTGHYRLHLPRRHSSSYRGFWR